MEAFTTFHGGEGFREEEKNECLFLNQERIRVKHREKETQNVNHLSRGSPGFVIIKKFIALLGGTGKLNFEPSFLMVVKIYLEGVE